MSKNALANLKTGTWLNTQEFPPATIGELTDSGECSPQCMAAQSDVHNCDCLCNGYYHGQARHFEISGYESNHPKEEGQQ